MQLIDEIQWVLRNARLNALDPTLRSAAGFAQGNGVATPVHRAQVGRWERGHVVMTRHLVRRYEQVLHLDEGTLLTAVDRFGRARNPVRSVAVLSPADEPDTDRTLLLLERALSEDRMTGLEWDELTDALGRIGRPLVRASDWEALLRRLLEETSLGLGIGYAQRSEALARLVGHARSGPLVAAMAAEVTGRPDAQFYNDPLGMLHHTDHPEAVSVVLDQLRRPTNPSVLRACLIVLTTLVQGRRLDGEVRLEAARLAVQHLRDPDLPYRVHRGAANLVRALGISAPRLATVLTAEDRRVAASIIRDGRAISAEAFRTSMKRIRAELEEAGGHESIEEPVLAHLLETALGSTDEGERGTALGILMVSPQAGVVGRVQARALADALGQGDVVAAHESLTILSWLGQAEDLDLFERVSLGPDTPTDVATTAGYVLGNAIEPSSPRRDARERAVALRVAGIVATGTGHDAGDHVRSLVYALGMRGRDDLLRALADALPAEPDPEPELATGLATELATGPDGRPADPTIGDPADRPRPGPDGVARGILGYWLGLPDHLRPDGEPA
ncbi:hypothetical protein [Intrasporangium flavum]|uniref:hypothetical protein n=1 Tax=Intrasporangium flavum TaxID=1428657 RepID=UPI00096CD1CA|nr:hypothetical protein [Intrasporangium flavum]